MAGRHQRCARHVRSDLLGHGRHRRLRVRRVERPARARRVRSRLDVQRRHLRSADQGARLAVERRGHVSRCRRARRMGRRSLRGRVDDRERRPDRARRLRNRRADRRRARARDRGRRRPDVARGRPAVHAGVRRRDEQQRARDRDRSGAGGDHPRARDRYRLVLLAAADRERLSRVVRSGGRLWPDGNRVSRRQRGSRRDDGTARRRLSRTGDRALAGGLLGDGRAQPRALHARDRRDGARRARRGLGGPGAASAVLGVPPGSYQFDQVCK